MTTYHVTVSVQGNVAYDFGYIPGKIALHAIAAAESTIHGRAFAKMPHACWLARKVYMATNGNV